MQSLPLSVMWSWAFSVLAQLVVFALLFLKGNIRKLPLFTVYSGLNICQAAFLALVYADPGLDRTTVARVAWTAEAATLLAQALATTEALGIVLRPYRGIWGLGWRTLAGTSAGVLIIVSLGSHGGWDWALFQANRGYHLTFATAVVACLVILRYYSVPVAKPYKLLLGGFCFFSCAMILIDTILVAVLYDRYYEYQSLWQLMTVLAFATVQAIWIFALRKPLPTEEPQAASPTDIMYRRLSPEINERLLQLNEKLIRLWKSEAHSR